MCSEMEKAYKIALAKIWVWKISTQNMCKNAQNCEKMRKKGKKLHKTKTFKKNSKNIKISTAVKN